MMSLPARMVLNLCLLTCLALGQSEPAWTRVATPLHFGYHADAKQVFGQYANTFYLPGRFSPGESMDDQLGCRNNGSAPPFWYANGIKMDGPRQVDIPAVGTVFNTSGNQKMRGLAFRGTWHPELSASGAFGAVFYSNNYCYMGTLEYGFQRDYSWSSPAYAGFYYLKYANCPANGSALCHVTDDNSRNSVVKQCSAGINFPDDIDLGNPNKWYEAYVFWDGAAKKHKFKVQVVDAKTRHRDWECIVDPVAADPFSGDSRCHRTVNGRTNYSQNSCDSTFPISSLYSTSGSVTLTVNTNNSRFPKHTPALEVHEIRIGN
jgi:hypothetical protein